MKRKVEVKAILSGKNRPVRQITHIVTAHKHEDLIKIAEYKLAKVYPKDTASIVTIREINNGA